MQYIDGFFGYEELEIKNNDGTETPDIDKEEDKEDPAMYHPRYDSGLDAQELYDQGVKTATGASLGMHIV